MIVIPTLLTVKGDDVIEKAIAAEVDFMNDKDFTESFLNQMSVQYGPKKAVKDGKETSEETSEETLSGIPV